MRRIRVYDEKGRERWVPAGTIIPPGWYDSDCVPIVKPMVVTSREEEGNPWDQYSRKICYLVLEPKKN